MQKYTIITGARGVSGGKVPSDKFWTISTNYIAYKTDGAFIREEGRLKKEGDDAEMAKLRKLLSTNSVAIISGTKDANAIVIHEILESKITTDTEANAIIEEELKPVTFTDDKLGEFVLNKSVNVFDCEIDLDDQTINISLDNREDITTAREVCKNLKKLVQDASTYASKEMLELANDWGNDAWEGDGEFPGITEEEFIRRVSLESISISEDSYTLWFSDGDLFWGHVICVYGNLENGFTDATMEG